MVNAVLVYLILVFVALLFTRPLSDHWTKRVAWVISGVLWPLILVVAAFMLIGTQIGKKQ